MKSVCASHPCPVCRGDHKCSIGEDGLIICGRRSGDVAGFDNLGPAKGDPQFNLYRSDGTESPREASTADGGEKTTPAIDWNKKTASYKKRLTSDSEMELAKALGLPPQELGRFRVGWSANQECWTCPEYDAGGKVVGINRRYRDGRKKMMAGGARGLYYARDWDQEEGPVLCPEGFSDAATLSAMGISAVGRPSNTGGVEQLGRILAGIPATRTIFVMGENDRKTDGSWPGKAGAISTAEQLQRELGRPVHFAFPPDEQKDIRSWFQAQEPELEDPEELEKLGKRLLNAIQENAREAIPWNPMLSLGDSPLPAFPTTALAPWQRDYVEALSVETQTPPDLAAMLVLAANAVAAAKKAVVRVRDGYTEPLNIFAMVAQPPAARKSAVFRDVAAPIEEYERLKVEEAKPHVAEARSKLAIAQKTLEELEKKASKEIGPKRESLLGDATALAKQIAAMKIPELTRLVCDDVTPECLASLMAAQGGRIAVLSPEGGVFQMMSGRYSPNRMANLSVYLKGHAGDMLRVDRRTRTELLDRPALTIGLAVQPDVIAGLAQNPSFRGQGLLGRFLYSMPDSLVGRRVVDPPRVPPTVRDTYKNRMLDLLKLPFGTGSSGEPAEHVIPLTEGAYSRWVEFSEWVEPQLGDFGALAHVSDWGGKLPGAVVRIAGLLHMADLVGQRDPWLVPLPSSTMDRAISIGQYLIPHARCAFAEMGTDPAIADARHVQRWIRRRGVDSFSQRDCFEGTKGRFVTVDALIPALQLLEKHHHIRVRPTVERPGRGRPPSPIYDVNPQVFQQPDTPHFVPFAPAIIANSAMQSSDPVESDTQPYQDGEATADPNCANSANQGCNPDPSPRSAPSTKTEGKPALQVGRTAAAENDAGESATSDEPVLHCSSPNNGDEDGVSILHGDDLYVPDSPRVEALEESPAEDDYEEGVL